MKRNQPSPPAPSPAETSGRGVKDTGVSEAAVEIHGYLKARLGHGWRLETWRAKYEARVRRYGLDACKAAVDGFCSVKWYVDNQSQNAPDLIFRSDKQLEKFLALGMKLPEHAPEVRIRRKLVSKEKERARELRERLEREQSGPTARMRKRLEALREEISEAGYAAFIAPLVYVAYERGVVILFHEQADWAIS